MLTLQREVSWAEERLLGDLLQSLPQTGRVHLHVIEYGAGSPSLADQDGPKRSR